MFLNSRATKIIKSTVVESYEEAISKIKPLDSFIFSVNKNENEEWNLDFYRLALGVSFLKKIIFIYLNKETRTFVLLDRVTIPLVYTSPSELLQIFYEKFSIKK